MPYVELHRREHLKEEGGVSEHSLHNAKVLFETYGIPDKLHLIADKQRVDYRVVTYWHRAGKVFTFTGFAWGYEGTAPHYFKEFLKLLSIVPEPGFFYTIMEDGKTDLKIHLPRV